MITEILLNEARERYPPGTKYIAAHTEDQICYVSDISSFRIISGYIIESTGNSDKNGHSYSEVLYSEGKGWAKIVEPLVNNHKFLL